MRLGHEDLIPLKTVDRLFATRAGEYISLPQIIVVGDQSSGKSSILEGLTKLPFPRESELCTRFATQIVFRREQVQRSISVSIIPHNDATDEHAAKVRAWGKPDLKEMDASTFAAIMKEVRLPIKKITFLLALNSLIGSYCNGARSRECEWAK